MVLSIFILDLLLLFKSGTLFMDQYLWQLLLYESRAAKRGSGEAGGKGDL
jgi:hypothetical protein